MCLSSWWISIYKGFCFCFGFFFTPPPFVPLSLSPKFTPFLGIFSDSLLRYSRYNVNYSTVLRKKNAYKMGEGGKWIIIRNSYFLSNISFILDYLIKSTYYKSLSLIFKPEISFCICTSNESNWWRNILESAFLQQR